MKKIIKVLSIILFSMIILFTCKGKVEAKSYEIQDMDIQAIINQDGSVSIEQKLTYKFNGEYNGIFINIPYNMESKSILKSNKINDSFYNGDNIVVNKVELINGTEEQEFKQVNTAFNGYSNVYTNIKKNGIQEIKIYSPSINTTKTFKVNYIIENLCVKHNDIGELYYNFIGGDWEVEIKKLNIDIYIPSNTEEIRIWGHGPDNGQSKIINNTHCNFKVNNVKAGQYVAARVLFNNSNIPNVQKVSGIDAKELVYKDENLIAENKEKKDSFTWKIIIFAICLLIYWIILMSIFENDKKYPVSNIKEEELFEKYNPMIAGCIQGSRTILARDIIAVILELINKQIINLENKPSMEKENYSYIITKNKELEDKMDNIERYVYNWVFDSNDSVVLTDRLKEMPKEKDSYIKFKALDNLVQSTLNQKGANQAKVPLCIRVFNIFLFIISIVAIYKHIMLNGINLYKSEINFETLILYIIYIFPLIPFLIGILYIL